MNTWDFTEAEFAAEMDALYKNALDPLLSESEHRDAFARLKKLITKAKRGQLSFGVIAPEAKVMERQPFVIELRAQPEPKSRFGQPNDPSRLVRLYCAEPSLREHEILGLHLGTKPNGPDDDNEQDESIDTAAERAVSWEMRQLVEKIGVEGDDA